MAESGFQPGNEFGKGRPLGSVNRRSEELRYRLKNRGDVDPADFCSSIVPSDKDPSLNSQPRTIFFVIFIQNEVP